MNPEDGYWTSRYIGSLIYEGEPGEESLDGIQTADGFIEWRGSAQNSQMQYFLRDHLGSVRVIASDRNTVISRSDYLPFGVRMTGNGLCGENSSSARSSYFGFSGKENEMWDGLDAMSGNTPHWLKGERYQHFGARAYDPVTCIFMQIDPMAEISYSYSAYSYAYYNPLSFIDKYGLTGVSVDEEPEKGAPEYYVLILKRACEGNPERIVLAQYLIDYGYKYCYKFTNKTKALTSDLGDKWIDEVAYNLQDMLETKTDENSGLLDDFESFKDFAFHSHVVAYKNNEKKENTPLTSLSTMDLVYIITTVEVGDIIKPESLRQIKDISSHLVMYWLKHPVVFMRRAAEGYFSRGTIMFNLYKYAASCIFKIEKYETPEEIREFLAQYQ